MYVRNISFVNPSILNHQSSFIVSCMFRINCLHLLFWQNEMRRVNMLFLPSVATPYCTTWRALIILVLAFRCGLVQMLMKNSSHKCSSSITIYRSNFHIDFRISKQFWLRILSWEWACAAWCSAFQPCPCFSSWWHIRLVIGLRCDKYSQFFSWVFFHWMNQWCSY